MIMNLCSRVIGSFCACSNKAKFLKVAFCVFIVGSCLTQSNNVAADLVEVTDGNYAGGANNVTRDTATNLDWLDWSVTTRQSFDDVVALTSPGQPLEGWRPAVRGEVQQLFDHIGLNTTSWPGLSETPGTIALDATALLGVTYDVNSVFGTQGITATTDGNGDYYYATTLYGFFSDTSSTFAMGTTPPSVPVGIGLTTNAGVALVRPIPVPEPASPAFAIVLLLLNPLRRGSRAAAKVLTTILPAESNEKGPQSI